MQQSYDSGDNTQLQSYMEANRMWMPMMLFSGIMDMMIFSSMMSFMGMGMNPIESAMIEDSAGTYQDPSSNGDVDTQSDDNGTSGDSDSTNNDYDDNGAFDSGGFDSFDPGSGGYDSF
jgi:hypothetical protein